MFDDTYRGRSVWLSGHTGFKGSWLSTWLLELGARVHGFALEPSTSPSLFEQLALESQVEHEIGDIRDASRVAASIYNAKPDFVFHLAAQPIVRASYEQPADTFTTNVIGTMHVLEALRSYNKPCAAVFVTSDKCYQNQEWSYAYREDDPLGGRDPYSGSKAAAEITIASYRASFFNAHPVKIASARAGNVIGGGDWAIDRIVPDTIRALQKNEPVSVRNKQSTRPWQHVLEPLSGYLLLGERLSQLDEERIQDRPRLCAAFNFGPGPTSNRRVADLVDEILKHWPGTWRDCSDADAAHEAALLNLAIDKAFHVLGWSPGWPFETTVRKTIEWYRAESEKADVGQLTQNQIAEYMESTSFLKKRRYVSYTGPDA